MLVIVGALVVTFSILGGYVMHHGNLAILYQPTEFIIIGGAAIGSLIIGTPVKVIKEILKSIPKLFGAGSINKKAYMELLGMLYNLFSRIRKEGVLDVKRISKVTSFADRVMINSDDPYDDFNRRVSILIEKEKK